MRILNLSAYYEPEKAASLYLFENINEAYVKAGHEVVLYAPMPTRGVSNDVYDEYKKKKYEKKYNCKLIIHRFSMFREGKNPVIRAMRYIFCNLIHLFKGIFAGKFDVIVVASTPPTQGALAAILKKIKNISAVYYLQDIFPDSLVNARLTKKYSLIWKIGRIIEDFTYRNMDKIIVISEDMKKNLIEKGVSEDKISIIYNWVDEDAIIPISKEQNIIFDDLKLSRDLFYIVYAGNLGHAQNIEVILKTASKMLNFIDIKFLIFGSGAQEIYYKTMAQNMGLSNVIFYPLQPYTLVSQVYSLGEASIVSCKEDIGRGAMPSKTWSIMSAGTAVLANFDENTDLHNIVESNNLGIFTKAGDYEELKEAILKLYNNRELCLEMGKNGRNFILNNLTRKIGTSKYLDVINSIVG